LGYAKITSDIEALKVSIVTSEERVMRELRSTESRIETRVIDLTAEMEEIWNWKNSHSESVLVLDAQQSERLKVVERDVDRCLKDWLGGIAIALTLAFGGAVWCGGALSE